MNEIGGRRAGNVGLIRCKHRQKHQRCDGTTMEPRMRWMSKAALTTRDGHRRHHGMTELKNLSYSFISCIFLMDKHADKQKETVHCYQSWKHCGVQSYSTPHHYCTPCSTVNLCTRLLGAFQQSNNISLDSLIGWPFGTCWSSEDLL